MSIVGVTSFFNVLFFLQKHIATTINKQQTMTDIAITTYMNHPDGSKLIYTPSSLIPFPSFTFSVGLDDGDCVGDDVAIDGLLLGLCVGAALGIVGSDVVGFAVVGLKVVGVVVVGVVDGLSVLVGLNVVGAVVVGMDVVGLKVVGFVVVGFLVVNVDDG